MASNFDIFLEQLNDVKTRPVSARFVSFSGKVEPSQYWKLSTALKSTAATGISLSGCQLGDKGLKMISEVLGSHEHLATVELPGNGITTAGAKALADVLRSSNFSVTTLDLSDNPCDADLGPVMASIWEYVNRNRMMPPNEAESSAVTDTNSSTVDSASLASGNRENTAWDVSRFAQMFTTCAADTEVISKSKYGIRLQKLEGSEVTISEALVAVRKQSADLEAWKVQMDATSHQAASLLSGIQGRVHRLRTGEQDVAQWQERMQARSAQVQGEVTDIADQHQGLRQRLTTLEAGVRHAEAVTQHSGEDVESQQEQDQLVQTRFKEEVLELQQQVQAIQHGQDQLQAVTGARQSINGLELANSISHWQERFNSLAEVIKEVDATVEGTLRVVLGDLGTGHKNLARGQQDLFARLNAAEQQQQSLVKELDNAQRKDAAQEAAWQVTHQRTVQDLQTRLARFEAALAQPSPLAQSPDEPQACEPVQSEAALSQPLTDADVQPPHDSYAKVRVLIRHSSDPVRACAGDLRDAVDDPDSAEPDVSKEVKCSEDTDGKSSLNCRLRVFKQPLKFFRKICSTFRILKGPRFL